MPLDSRNSAPFLSSEQEQVQPNENYRDSGSLKGTLKSAYRYFWGEGLSHFFYRTGGGSQHVRSFLNNKNKKLLIISPGRGESSLKYAEICQELKSAGFDIVVVDHRGQGFSERAGEVGNFGHIEEFENYSSDLEAISLHFKERKIALGSEYKKTLLLAHSMGCSAALLSQYKSADFCDGMILSSPMFRVLTPVPHYLANFLIRLIRLTFVSKNCVKGVEARERSLSFQGNILTQCEERFGHFRELEKRHPQIKCGPPTFSWLGEALKVTRKVFKGGSNLNIPILVMQAEQDQLVCNKTQDRFMLKLKNGRIIKLKESKHEILQERSSIRNRAFVQIHKFLKEN
jgi:lysophospholipase